MTKDQRDSENPHMPATLMALLTHPDFLRGWVYGGEWFDTEYSDEPITETTVHQFLERTFSEQARKRNTHFAQSIGSPAPSFLYTIGFATCWLDKALATMNC